jgi:hypothetical protein
MLEIIVAGDSHTQAHKQALAHRPNANGFHIVWIKGPEGSHAAKNGDISFDELLERVRNTEHALIAISLLGNLSNSFGLAKHDKPFYVLVEGEEGEGELIPRGVMRDIFQTRISAASKRFIKIKQATTAPVYHLATPPPKGDQELLQARFNRHDRKINSPSQRLALWQMEMEVVKAACAECGVGFVNPPTATQDRQGYLGRDFYSTDITHANAAYGEFVLRQLEELATT